MQHTPTFQHFMQDLYKNLNAPSRGNAKPHTDACSDTGHVFEVEITEGHACGDIVFCVRLGIAGNTPNTAGLRILLTHNRPQTGAVPNIVGIHAKGQEFCLWCRESIQNLQLAPCVEMLQRLLGEAQELKKQFDASISCLPPDFH